MNAKNIHLFILRGYDRKKPVYLIGAVNLISNGTEAFYTRKHRPDQRIILFYGLTISLN